MRIRLPNCKLGVLAHTLQKHSEGANMKFAASLVIYWLLKIGAREIQLSGNNFISYDLTSSFSWLLLRSNHSIKLGFKTLEPNALLFYVGYERRKGRFCID